MKSELHYKGYIGSVEVDLDGNAIVGKLLFITDVIAYSADKLADIQAAFREAVDEYLQVCADLSKAPERPCKGTFNVRVGPQLHRDAALRARREGITLNDLVTEALRASLSPRQSGTNHTHLHIHTQAASQLVETSDTNGWQRKTVSTVQGATGHVRH